MRGYVIYTAHKMSLECCNQGGWDWHDMWHIWDRKKIGLAGCKTWRKV